MMREPTIAEIASMFGKKVDAGKRTFCLLRKHQRRDKTMGIFRGSDGSEMFKCWSCDPPDNAGDAIKLYQLLAGVDRNAAWRELRDRGYRVPGASDNYRGNSHSAPPVRKAVVPIEGRKPTADSILPLDLGLWRRWQEQRLGTVERFAEKRGLPAEALRRLDVVDISKDAIGFGYRDPATGLPCRVKVRTVERKSFWIEPRAPEGVSAVALSPLYLAHALQFLPGGLGTIMVMTEGEVDALTLRTVGINNVVSLPDGAQSANRVNLDPVWTGTALVLSAVDVDEEGDKAHFELFRRTTAMHKSIARVRWRKTDTEAAFKDANEALLAGFTRDDFLGCLQRAADEAMGFQVNLGQACLATG